ncbi:MAG TPA: hypothetical protein VJ924_17090, partial [Alphaproteobacteria bacterium]|nr:hypothetical protein [Alphaproteobacteria bacterium]
MPYGFRGRFVPHCLALTVAFALAPFAADAELMIVANDEKVTWDESGKLVIMPPGKDSIVIVDIGKARENPRIVATLP